MLQRGDGQHCREARGADSHSLPQIVSGRYGNHCIGGETSGLRESAPARFAEALSGGQDAISGFKFGNGGFLDGSRQVNPANHGKSADDFAAAENSQAVLVIQRRISHANKDLAGGKIRFLEVLERNAVLAAFLFPR